MTDLMQRLTAARPTDDDLEAAWSASDRDLALAKLRARSTRPGARRRTPWLAAVASVQSSPQLAPGTFLHMKTEAVQENGRIFADGETLDTNREQWVSWKGDVLAIDTRPSAGWTEYQEFLGADLEPSSFSGPTPEFAASLPDSAPELAAFLNENVSGSNSHDEAMFVAITDLARSNFLPPQTLGAALEVLSEVDGVSVDDGDVDGRAAVEVSYQSWWQRLIVRKTVTIDKQTARVIGERESDPTGSYRVDTVLSEVVSEVPSDVLAAFEAHHDGERVYD